MREHHPALLQIVLRERRYRLARIRSERDVAVRGIRHRERQVLRLVIGIERREVGRGQPHRAALGDREIKVARNRRRHVAHAGGKFTALVHGKAAVFDVTRHGAGAPDSDQLLDAHIALKLAVHFSVLSPDGAKQTALRINHHFAGIELPLDVTGNLDFPAVAYFALEDRILANDKHTTIIGHVNTPKPYAKSGLDQNRYFREGICQLVVGCAMGMPCGGLASPRLRLASAPGRTEAAMQLGSTSRRALLALAMTAGAALAEPAAGWQTVRPEGEPFTIDMPGGAKEEATDMADDPANPLMAKTYTVETVAGWAYIANCTKLPEPQAEAARADPQAMLLKVRDGSLRGMTATLASDKELTIDGHPAREVTGHTSDGHSMSSRMAIVGPHLCQAIAVTPTIFVGSDDIRRFLDSLRFTAPK